MIFLWWLERNTGAFMISFAKHGAVSGNYIYYIVVLTLKYQILTNVTNDGYS